MFNVNYNPDVLTCLANLSNDEVFTPPDIANEMLDKLPEDLWCNKNTTFLDPCTKSGIFLREITKNSTTQCTPLPLASSAYLRWLPSPPLHTTFSKSVFKIF